MDVLQVLKASINDRLNPLRSAMRRKTKAKKNAGTPYNTATLIHWINLDVGETYEANFDSNRSDIDLSDGLRSNAGGHVF